MNSMERLDGMLACAARRGAACERRRQYIRMQSKALLTMPRTPEANAVAQRLDDGVRRFTPGFYFPPSWPEPVRRAFFGLR